MTKTIEERFWEKVNKNGPIPEHRPELGPCWIWTGCRLKLRNQPYGLFNWNGVLRRVHRLSWEMFNGLIPEGIGVCHACDNPSCVNPKHLFLGTQSDNIKDAFLKGRLPKIHGKGEANGAPHKLTEFKVKEMRDLRASNPRLWSHYVLGRRYNVSRNLIGNIIARKRWSHI